MTNMTEDQFDATADKFRHTGVWWIEDNKWYKNTIWGKPENYGEVKLSKKDQEKFKKKNINY